MKEQHKPKELPERWRPDDGLTLREENVLYQWLGVIHGQSNRSMMRDIAAKEGLSLSHVNQIIKLATLKLAVIYMKNTGHLPQPYPSKQVRDVLFPGE